MDLRREAISERRDGSPSFLSVKGVTRYVTHCTPTTQFNMKIWNHSKAKVLKHVYRIVLLKTPYFRAIFLIFTKKFNSKISERRDGSPSFLSVKGVTRWGAHCTPTTQFYDLWNYQHWAVRFIKIWDKIWNFGHWGAKMVFWILISVKNREKLEFAF